MHANGQEAYCVPEVCKLAIFDEGSFQEAEGAGHRKVQVAAVQQLCQAALQHHLHSTSHTGFLHNHQYGDNQWIYCNQQQS